MIYIKLLLLVSFLLALSLIGIGIKAWMKKKEVILSSCGGLGKEDCGICKNKSNCKELN